MGLYRRRDSPFWWIWIERPVGQRPVRESTRVRRDAPTAEGRKDNRGLAEAIYHRRARELRTGDLGLAPAPTTTFDAQARWYEQHVTPLHASAARERSVLTRLRAHFGTRPLQQVDRAAVLEWRAGRLGQVAAATVDRELDVLKSVLAAAVPKYLPASPIAGLKRHRDTVQAKTRRPRILTREEEARLLDAATAIEDRALMLLALDPVLRLSDVRPLRRVRDYGTAIHVEHPKVEPYDVPVSDRLRAALDALPVRGPYYFPRRWGGREGGISVNTVWRIFRQLCSAADIPVGRKVRGVTFHSLRHTGTTRMLEAGVNPIAVMEIGGWTELRQLLRYGRASAEGKRAAVNTIGGPPHSRLAPPPENS